MIKVISDRLQLDVTVVVRPGPDAIVLWTSNPKLAEWCDHKISVRFKIPSVTQQDTDFMYSAALYTEVYEDLLLKTILRLKCTRSQYCENMIHK